MISPLDTEVCRVHGLPHHIVDDYNEQEWQQYAALLDSRGNGEERCNAGGCIDAATRVVISYLEDCDTSLLNTVDTQYFPQWRSMDRVKHLFEVYKIDN